MEKNFTVTDFTNVIKFVFNRSDYDFADMYNAISFIGIGYINEKFDLARKNFGIWWCELDPSTQEKVVEYVRSFYKK